MSKMTKKFKGGLLWDVKNDAHVHYQVEDEKCPENCTTGNCIVIPFQLASSIRQILLITDQTHYRRGQKGKKNDKRYLIL